MAGREPEAQDLFESLPEQDEQVTARLHERLAAAAARRAFSTSPTARSTPRRRAAAGRRPSRAWSGSPTRTEDHDAVLAKLAELVSPRILNAPARLDEVARELDEYFARRRRAFDVPVDLRLAKGFRCSVLAHLPEHPLRGDGELRPGGGGRRPPARGPRGRHRVRDQPGADRGALPPGGALRRLARRLRRRRRTSSGRC